jgi:hypothetical protein cdifQCD-7_20152
MTKNNVNNSCKNENINKNINERYLNENKFYMGRYDLSATIYVPVDCKYNCKFCTSKWIYKNLNHNWNQMKNSIHKLIDFGISIFVLTGGDPLEDLTITKQIIDEIRNYKPEKNKKRMIYVNTNFPIGIRYEDKSVEEKISFINENLNGFSFSLRFSDDYGYSSNVDLKDTEINILNKINIPFRINLVLDDNFNLDNLDKTFSRLKYRLHGNDKYVFNLREDFRKTTNETLHERDEVFKYLFKKYKFINHEECNVCNVDVFLDDDNIPILYHKGIMFTLFKLSRHEYEVNDIIVHPNGKIYFDWNFNEEFKCNLNEIIP